MANYNHWTGIGRLTKDPELRYTPTGTAVCQFTLAINHYYKNAAGEQKEEAAFVSVEFWKRSAEVIAGHAHKGTELLVEGRLKTDTWEDKNSGQRRSRLKVVGSRWQFTQPKGAEDKRQPRAAADTSAPAEGDSDIPF
jgi:single-strand DNA-binding protein